MKYILSSNVSTNTHANKVIKVRCISCKQETNHLIIVDYEEYQIDEDFNPWVTDYQIVKCSGCDDISFRKIASDNNKEAISAYHRDDIIYYEIGRASCRERV